MTRGNLLWLRGPATDDTTRVVRGDGVTFPLTLQQAGSSAATDPLVVFQTPRGSVCVFPTAPQVVEFACGNCH